MSEILKALGRGVKQFTDHTKETYGIAKDLSEGSLSLIGKGAELGGEAAEKIYQGGSYVSSKIAGAPESYVGRVFGAAAGTAGYAGSIVAAAGTAGAGLTAGIAGAVGKATGAALTATAYGIGKPALKGTAETVGSFLRSTWGRDNAAVMKNSALGKDLKAAFGQTGENIAGGIGRTLGNMSNPIGVAANALGWAGSKMIKINPGKKTWDATKKEFVTESPSIGLTKTGYGTLFGGGILANSREAYDTFNAHTLGIIDSKATNATPDYNPQTYSRQPPVGSLNDHAGATGDLVFSLFRNRRNSML